MSAITINGRVCDVSDGSGIINAHITDSGNPNNDAYTDGNGLFTLTVADPSNTVIIEADNYGDFAGSAGGITTDPVYLYKTSASVVTKVTATVKNNKSTVTIIIIIAAALFFFRKRIFK